MLPELSDKNADINDIAEKALQDEALLSELVDGLESKKETYRYNCFKVLMIISREHGKVLYPRWDYFAEHLSSNNTYRIISAIQIIANLVKVDADNKFDNIFDEYYGLLGAKGTIVPAYAAVSSGKIAGAKPHLRDRITEKLLNIDKVYPGKQLALIQGQAVEALSDYFAEADNKDKIIGFVKSQLNSESPRTRKQAKQFLNKWGHA